VGACKAAIPIRARGRVTAKPATRGAFLARPLNVCLDAPQPIWRYSSNVSDLATANNPVNIRRGEASSAWKCERAKTV
jgi:hypothetical protein